MKGKKKSEAHCKNISLSQKGKVFSEETKEKISQSLKGRKMPYVAEQNRNRIYTPEQRKARSLQRRKEFAMGLHRRPDYIVSEETKIKIADSHRGSKAYNYIAYRAKLKKSDRHHLDGQYVDWQKSIKQRDGWKCQLIDENCKGKVVAHHIQNWKEFPKLRYTLTNGITLCHAHHPRGREKEKLLAPLLQALLNKGG